LADGEGGKNMEEKIENIIKKSGELTIEKIKEASKKLCDNEKFMSLQKRLSKLVQTMEDFEKSVEEMKKNTDESLLKSVESNYKNEMERIVGAITGMILEESGAPIKEDVSVSIDSMIDDVLAKDLEEGGGEWIRIEKRDQPEENK
jgi:glutamyl-tRNA reductase